MATPAARARYRRWHGHRHGLSGWRGRCRGGGRGRGRWAGAGAGAAAVCVGARAGAGRVDGCTSAPGRGGGGTLLPVCLLRNFSTFHDTLAKPQLVEVHWPVSENERLVDRVKPYIERLNNREVTILAVAAELGVNPNYLTKVLKPLLSRIESTTKYRKNRSNLRESRRKYREFLAKRVKSGEITVETAAICANCSIRTIYRYLDRIN
jgi:hypothetical protein